MLDQAWLIPALPLGGAAVNLFFGRRLGKAAGWVASATVGLAFAIGVAVLLELIDPVVIGVRQVEKLSDRPVLGTVPYVG